MGTLETIGYGWRLASGPALIAASALLAPQALAQTSLGQSTPAGLAQTQPASSVSGAPTAMRAPASAGPGVSLRYGYHSKYQRFALAYETPSLWSHSFTNNGRLDLSIALGAGYWKAFSREPDSMWDVAIVPTLRWWPGDSYYLELGVGPTLLSRTNFAGKELSTRFQFTSHFGGGIVINDAHRFGIRYTHISNASIKTPNPGLDLIEASYTYQF